MIKTPVARHDVFTSSFVDKFGSFLDDKSLEEAAKRINMHDELINALSMMTDIASQVDGWESFPSCAIADAESVLEKCK